jgi:hypothetical protein
MHRHARSDLAVFRERHFGRQESRRGGEELANQRGGACKARRSEQPGNRASTRDCYADVAAARPRASSGWVHVTRTPLVSSITAGAPRPSRSMVTTQFPHCRPRHAGRRAMPHHGSTS